MPEYEIPRSDRPMGVEFKHSEYVGSLRADSWTAADIAAFPQLSEEQLILLKMSESRTPTQILGTYRELAAGRSPEHASGSSTTSNEVALPELTADERAAATRMGCDLKVYAETKAELYPTLRPLGDRSRAGKQERADEWIKSWLSARPACQAWYGGLPENEQRKFLQAGRQAFGSAPILENAR